MKKTFLVYVIAYTIVAVSCEKESLHAIKEKEKMFTAQIEQGFTRTVLVDGVKINWELKDEININGSIYSAMPKADATKADFFYSSGEIPKSPYYAIYPASLYVSGHFELPSIQTYIVGGLNAPMYAASVMESLAFKNICAIIALSVKSSDIHNIKKIRVSSGNCAMCGSFSIVENKAVLDTPNAITNKIILDCGSKGVSPTKEGTVFYIAIPAQTYKNLIIELSEDGSKYSKAMGTKANSDITVAANTVYKFNFEQHYVENGISYGKGIPIEASSTTIVWAPVNCGYSATDYKYGRLYQWGRKYGQGYRGDDDDFPDKPGGQQKSVYLEDYQNRLKNHPDGNSYNGKFYWYQYNWYGGSGDSKLWNTASGANSAYEIEKVVPTKSQYDPCPTGWRVPTYYEMNALLSLTHSWVTEKDFVAGITSGPANGGIFGSSPNQVFLPAAGRHSDYYDQCEERNEEGYYWTSSVPNSGGSFYQESARLLRLNSSHFKMSYNTRSLGHSIRCVRE
ncbi:MAG: hypothetical protein MJY48_05280 [Bacteroidales bacterium]|nr:hypothetical protein [Bacteroidales bacterium]